MRFSEWVIRPFEARREQAAGGAWGWRSPLGVFILFGIAFTLVFTFAHIFVEMGLSLLPPVSFWVEQVAETVATLVFLLPPFYLLVLQPLARYIADRAEAEATVRASEQQLSSIFDTAADVIYLHTVEQDGHYRFAAINRAFQTVTGLTADQVVGKRVDEVIPQPSLTFVLDKYKEAIREKRIVRWEETSEYPAGRLVGEVSVAPIFNDAGVCTYLVGTVHDIAERKRMEAALRISEERYRSLVETTTVGVFETGSDGTIVYANEAVATLLELDSAQQMLNAQAPDFYKEPSRREELLRILRSDGKVSAFEVAVLTSRGNERQVLLSASLNNGTIRGVLVDITELKQAEKEREASLALVRSLVQGMPDALVITNDQGLIVDVNVQTEKTFGYQRAEILGKPIEILVPEQFREKHVRHRAGYYVRPRLRPMSPVMGMYGRHKDGSEFPIDVLLSPMETPTGLVVLASVRDITEQKQLQAQLMQSDRLATVGSVVSGIAHEVNNPLAGALGRADLVLRGNLDDALKKDIEVIRSEIWRAALTVRQLLTFAREHKSERSSISINETLEATLALRQYELTAANVQVVKDLQSDLPSTTADRNQIQQVFLNIILNAEQAMTAAHGRGTLSLMTCQVGDTIVVTIADDGPGIAQEHLSRVFDPFFTTKPEGKGTGLGLSVSHGIIQEHGGAICVASKVGKGAVFTVVLPISTEGQTGN